MGIFSGLLDEQRQQARESRASLNNSSVPLSLASFLGWLGAGEPTASGEIINATTALQISDVYSCVRVITEAIASLPLVIYEVRDDGTRQRVDHDLTWILATEPNDEMSAPTLWESFVGAMALVGNGYSEILRNSYGQVAGLYPLSPGITSPRRNPRTKELEYVTTSGMADGRERVIAKEDMLHCPLFSLEGLKGLSPIGLARQMLGLSRAAEKFGARFFGNGAFPGGILTPDPTVGPVTDKQKGDLKDSWERNYGGENQGRVAVMTAPWKWQAIGLSPEDSQFLGTQQFTRTRIASLFRLNPHQIGDTTRLSNNNVEQLNLGFVTDTLRPYLHRIEKAVSIKLLPRIGQKAYRLIAEFDVSERQRGDFKSTMDGIAVARQWGLYTIDDGRRKLGMNPIGRAAGGELCMVPVNMQNAERLLDTEPTLDQPLDPDTGKPALPAPKSDEEDEDEGVDDKSERALLGDYAVQFGMPFVGVVRASAGNIEALRVGLEPVAHGIADRAARSHPFAFWPDGVSDQIAAEAVEGVVRRMRRKGLPKEPDQSFCREEFRRIIRAIHIQTAREAAAIEAERQVQEGVIHARTQIYPRR